MEGRGITTIRHSHVLLEKDSRLGVFSPKEVTQCYASSKFVCTRKRRSTCCKCFAIKLRPLRGRGDRIRTDITLVEGEVTHICRIVQKLSERKGRRTCKCCATVTLSLHVVQRAGFEPTLALYQREVTHVNRISQSPDSRVRTCGLLFPKQTDYHFPISGYGPRAKPMKVSLALIFVE